jgi:hypothetical protein
LTGDSAEEGRAKRQFQIASPHADIINVEARKGARTMGPIVFGHDNPEDKATTAAVIRARHRTK